jgi:hypothetical protein
MPVASTKDMKRALLAVLMLSACDNFASSPPASMPWLQGFSATAATDTLTPQASRRIAGVLDATQEEAYGSLELRADLAGDPQPETVLASYHLGLAVVDVSGRLVARAPGFDVEGSADDLISMAAGDGQLGWPVIVLAVQSGGHRESTISVAVYRIASTRMLQKLWYAPIEIREGSETRTGTLTFTRSGLLYRAPGASAVTSWTFDVRRGRYVERAPVASNTARRDI